MPWITWVTRSHGDDHQGWHVAICMKLEIGTSNQAGAVKSDEALPSTQGHAPTSSWLWWRGSATVSVGAPGRFADRGEGPTHAAGLGLQTIASRSPSNSLSAIVSGCMPRDAASSGWSGSSRCPG
jgi:hypothetical protein